MSKPTLRVLKLCNLSCFKTSLLLGTTGVRARSEFCRPWQKLNRLLGTTAIRARSEFLPSVAKPTLRVLKLCNLSCFKTSLLLGTTGVRARSDFSVHGKTKPASFKAL
ncbi:hypothetical protein [Treponema phagedenis]|uniref:hypothetical protein n=1 Tax=Treponema phagedenis TaxID=162 RepID=UPI0016531B09|nr:hypothetical protein [Treponema phagedenis]